jgi:enoyl-CoA hydratase
MTSTNENTPAILDKHPLWSELTLNSPQTLNALSLEMLKSLQSAITEIKPDIEKHKCQVLLVRSSSPKAFAAGADIKLMQSGETNTVKEFIELGQSIFKEISSLACPVIAIVEGYALGGGMELALACDLIVASEKARFAQPEVNLGLIPGWGGTQRLTRRVGEGRAKQIILTGESLEASEAYRVGVCDYLIAPEQLDSFIGKLLETLISKGPQALAFAKKSISSAFSYDLEKGLEQEKELFMQCLTSSEGKEGLSAFLEKRKPKFTA